MAVTVGDKAELEKFGLRLTRFAPVSEAFSKSIDHESEVSEAVMWAAILSQVSTLQTLREERSLH